ncbi:MAG: carbohydrate hydrolase [Desulfitibacter sp. BRH_c19]|nr:MAG: carbohydrate hydrolase [Desulfitibacter sp. BRH_c19]
MHFNGFVRENGDVGIRNHLLILSSVVCANTVAANIASGIPEARLITHQHGCSQIGVDKETTLKILSGMGKNPNVGAVLVVGLGCETIHAGLIAQEIAKTGKPVETLVIQEVGGTLATTEKGIMIGRKLMLALAEQKRESISIERLTLGTECGGSDAYSGLSANPALGAASDMLVDLGSRVILSETTEFIGAEHILCKRAVNSQVASQIKRIVADREMDCLKLKVDIRGAQPSPGNIAGGLTTIEEKSLGCIYKGGSRPIVQVVGYGDESTQQGLVIMDTPGNDVESITGMAAGGAQLVVFTTGRGTPVGCPIVPVIKVSTNNKTYELMEENIDINAGTIISGEGKIDQVGANIFEEILKTANGKLTKAEKLGHFEFGLSRLGPSL